MRIGIDYSPVAGQRTGVGQYTHNLVHALSRIDKDNRYVLYPFFYYIFDPNYRDADFPSAENFSVPFMKLRLPMRLVQYFRYFWFATPERIKELALGDVDVVHSNTFCAPRFRSKTKKLVVTVYDLTVLTHPECHRKANIKHCLAGTKKAVEYADAIVAISEHTKRDLIEHLDCPPELITVTPLAADPMYRPVDDPVEHEKVRTRYGLPERYILFIGSLEPRKNVKTLVKAFSMLPETISRSHQLVVAGARGWKNSEVFDMVRELGIEDRVLFTGYIDREDISAVYSMAEVFVYPSLYEGFGLPILEAMACGTPVITSNTSSMPEVAGDAAILITPTDTDQLASELARVLDDDALRLEMRARGLERSGEFTWERCARETLGVYEKVHASGRRGA